MTMEDSSINKVVHGTFTLTIFDPCAVKPVDALTPDATVKAYYTKKTVEVNDFRIDNPFENIFRKECFEYSIHFIDMSLV